MTGLRQGERLALRWKDVDFTNNMIYVKQTLAHNGKKIKPGAKTNRSFRGVMIDSKTKDALLKQFKMIQLEKRHVKDYQDNDLVFLYKQGYAMYPTKSNEDV